MSGRIDERYFYAAIRGGGHKGVGLVNSGRGRNIGRVFGFLMLTLSAWAQQSHPILALGSPAPNFELPGVDGKTHKLADYASSPILVVVFTCNHCPIAQMYERRIAQLAADYKDRGVAVVAIQPNDPKAIRIDELDSSDISDSLDGDEDPGRNTSI